MIHTLKVPAATMELSNSRNFPKEFGVDIEIINFKDVSNSE